ncbi:hypothetical protein NE237_020251 [Protea cynaroides]|uniref:Uncharacterized protein n=1 Tax=Protea cynaroides TaxID=273540 RepID=A0A9Q0H824_9MAGN|nr:hypothetical protein NE237_020251 [Protea cynaroides]
MAKKGDILMLEARPDASRPSWSAVWTEEMVDALPYIDDDYGNPNVKEEVDRLVEEEMRRGIKKPADFLKEFPPVPKLNFEKNTAVELNALSAQWKELCEKNIEIEAACAKIDIDIEELKTEAAERGWSLEVNMENGTLVHSEHRGILLGLEWNFAVLSCEHICYTV